VIADSIAASGAFIKDRKETVRRFTRADVFFLLDPHGWLDYSSSNRVTPGIVSMKRSSKNGGTVTANKPITLPTTKSIASYVRRNALKVKKAQRHVHKPSESVREADYGGHHIVIRTTYQIEVDGVPLMGHMGVTDDGRVHYHPVPNASFPSAVDLVKELIDLFPDDFTGGGTSGHGGGHMQMGARRKGRGRARSSK